MQLTLFQIVNYLLILILLILFIRYIWVYYLFRDTTPVGWKNAEKEGRITDDLRRLKKKAPDKARFFSWWLQVERLQRESVAGVFVELGVYKGESAKALHHMALNRIFHLFDTFTGFPAQDLRGETGEAATYTPANFADTSVEAVMRHIGNTQNIVVHPGYFPQSAEAFCEPVALVNMDVDLYKPTLAGLKFFYPLLSPGGIILIHDYTYKWPGVVSAVDQFVASIPENLVFLPDVDGTVMIIRNK